MRARTAVFVVTCVMNLGLARALPAGQPDPHVSPAFAAPGLNARVRAMTVYDDGNGSALYIGGEFVTAAGLIAPGVVRWDGTSYSPVGKEMSYVTELAVWDDGNGPRLYAGGSYLQSGGLPQHVARWDGTTWTPLGSPFQPSVRALHVFDAGSGAELYASSASYPYVARWDGAQWVSTGSGAPPAYDLQGFAGQLHAADYGSVKRLNTTGWTPLPDSQGSHLIVSLDLGGGPTLQIARGGLGIFDWNGVSWTPLGGTTNSLIYTMHAHQGAVATLLIGGYFTTVDSLPAARVAQWNSGTWVGLGRGISDGSVWTLAVYDAGAGEEIYAGGEFRSADGGAVVSPNLARWDGTQWIAMPTGSPAFGTDGEVWGLSFVDDVDGGMVYASGHFETAGGNAVPGVAGFDGQRWLPIGPGWPHTQGEAHFARFDDGSGSALYAGTQEDPWLLRWDGATWTPVPGFDGPVRHLFVFDDGSGEALYVGGAFTQAGGIAAQSIARLTPNGWAQVGAGMNGPVERFGVLHDQPTPTLALIGDFTNAGFYPMAGIARWDGQSFSTVGFEWLKEPTDLITFDDGQGEALYVAVKNEILRWDGASWTTFAVADLRVDALAVFDDGFGPALYATGWFSQIDGVVASRVARFACGGWVAGPELALLGGSTPEGYALSRGPASFGRSLFFGGNFQTADGVPASNIAAWVGLESPALSSFGTGCTGSGGIAPTLTVAGCPRPGGDLHLRVERGAGGAMAAILIGGGEGERPVGGRCSLLLQPLYPAMFVTSLDPGGAGEGATSLFGTLPASLPPTTITAQAWIADPGSPIGHTVTHGVTIRVP